MFYFLQISVNGLISLGDSFYDGEVEHFSTVLLFEAALIAPLWTDLVFDGPGRLFYRVSKIPSDLDIIANLIANASSENDYRPTLAIIATWDNVRMRYGISRVSVLQ